MYKLSISIVAYNQIRTGISDIFNIIIMVIEYSKFK